MNNRFYWLAFVLSLLLFLQPAAAQTNGADCSSLVIGRTYGHQFGGYLNAGTIVPYAGGGYFEFLPGGVVKGSSTIVVGGMVRLLDLPADGTYTLTWKTGTSPAVCAGQVVSGTNIFQAVVLDNGNAIEYFHNDDKGLVVGFTGTPMKDRKCDLGTIKGTYIYNAKGWIMPPPLPFELATLSADYPYTPFGFSGAISFDGNGGLTGWDTVSLNGLIMPRTYVGTYDVKSNCMASMELNDDIGNPTIHTENIVLKNGKALHVINTDFPRTVLAFTATKTSD